MGGGGGGTQSFSHAEGGGGQNKFLGGHERFTLSRGGRKQFWTCDFPIL